MSVEIDNGDYYDNISSLRSFLACSIIYCLFAIFSVGLVWTYSCHGVCQPKDEDENCDDYIVAKTVDPEAKFYNNDGEDAAEDKQANHTPQ